MTCGVPDLNTAKFGLLKAGRIGILLLSLLLGLSACVVQPDSVLDTEVLGTIQETLDQAAVSNQPSTFKPVSGDDILDELLPSLSIDDDALITIPERFDIVVSSQPARDFFNNLVAGTNYGVVVAPEVSGDIADLTLPAVTIDEAMRTIASIYGLQITRERNIYYVRSGGMETRQFTIDYLNVHRAGSSNVSVTGANASGGGLGGGLNSGLGGGLGGVGTLGGLGGGIGGSLGGIGGGLNGGLNSGLGGLNSGLGGTSGGGGGQVSTQTESDFWEDVRESIEQLVGVNGGSGEQGRQVMIQPQLGLIVVTAMPDELARVEKFIEAAQESLRREVVIQIQFLEVVLNKGYQSAIDFDTFGPDEVEFGSTNGIRAQTSSLNANLDANSNPIQFSTNFTDFEAVFRLLQRRGTTQVISSPNLRALNNQKAVFQDGDSEYFQTSIGSTVVAGGNATTTSSQSDLQSFFSGISMDITPQISANGEITLHVHPTISTTTEQPKSVGGQVAPLPRSSIREIDSIIKAENGKIVVLGGLAYERSANEAAGLPGAERIPLVGAALESRQRTSVKSEFIILLKPIIANSTNDRTLINESNARFRDINRTIDPFLNQ